LRKVLVIAARDYKAAVRTKAFVISLLVLPLMMGGSFLVQKLVKNQVDTTEKRFAVIDRTPGRLLYPALEGAARMRNQTEIRDPQTGYQTKPVFALESVEVQPSQDIDQVRFALSERVRKQELFGFLEIEPDVLQYRPGQTSPAREPEDPFAAPAVSPSGLPPAVRYQSNSPTYDAFENWAQKILTAAVEEQRLAALKVRMTPAELRAIVQPVNIAAKGLSRRDPVTGHIEDAADENQILSIAVPGGLMLLMFMLILISATPLMQGVVEEKMQRIAEVLLGSVRPFQLMTGKLLGMVGVSATLAAVYLGAGYWAAYRYHFAEYIPGELLAWFGVFLTLAVLMFGSIFIAIGAACSDMRETQTMVWPVMLLITIPMFVWVNVLREPNSSFSTWISLFPFATPTLMLGRLAIPPGVPWWQPALGVTLVLLTTTLCLYAAGRIFRVGILMQGKGAQIGEVVKWIFRG
jgi:ABC-2 type transport system permease protein